MSCNYLITGFRNKIISKSLQNIGLNEKKTFTKDLDLLIYNNPNKSKSKIDKAKNNNVTIFDISRDIPIKYNYYFSNKYNNINNINNIKNKLKIIIDNRLNIHNYTKIKINYEPYFINFVDLDHNTITIIDKKNKVAKIYFIIIKNFPINNKFKFKTHKEYNTNFLSFENNNNLYFYNYINDNNDSQFHFMITYNEPINIIKFDDYYISHKYFMTDLNTLNNPIGNMILFSKNNKYKIFDTYSYNFTKYELDYNDSYNKKLPNFKDVITFNQISYRYYIYNYYFITNDKIYRYEPSTKVLVHIYNVKDIKEKMFNEYINLRKKILNMQKNKYKREPLDNSYIYNNADELYNFLLYIFDLNKLKKITNKNMTVKIKNTQTNKILSYSNNVKMQIKDTIGLFNDAIVLHRY
jgi:hypothetical protein